MLLVGLTGGIGSGKSEAARLLAGHGAVVIDADVVAREVVAAGTPGLAAVVEEFGDGVLAADGSLDRAALAAVVFGDEAARSRLNAIVHPLVRARTGEAVLAAAERDPDAVVVNDVPLLVEAGLAGGYDEVVVVDVPTEVARDRLVSQRGMSDADARARIAAQASREQRLAVATHVLDNSGDRAALSEAVERLWPRLQERAGQR